MPDKCASCDPCCLSPVQYIASLRLESEPMFRGSTKEPTTFKIIVTVKVAYQLWLECLKTLQMSFCCQLLGRQWRPFWQGVPQMDSGWWDEKKNCPWTVCLLNEPHDKWFVREMSVWWYESLKTKSQCCNTLYFLKHHIKRLFWDNRFLGYTKLILK